MVEINNIIVEEVDKYNLGRSKVIAVLPRAYIDIRGSIIDTIIDTGAELNLINYSKARNSRLVIQSLPESIEYILIKGVTGQLVSFIGLIYDAPVKIGSIIIKTYFLVTRKLLVPVLLGKP